MEHVAASAAVNADPDALWRQIGSFQGVAGWHPMLAGVEGHGERPGSVRKATGTDGSEQVERLIEADPSARFYRYVMEVTAMPVSRYRGELRVQDGGHGTSVVEWTSDFDATTEPAAQAVDLVRGFLQAGLRNIEEQYN
jgi:hypothetical protein